MRTISFFIQYGCELSPEESAPAVGIYISGDLRQATYAEYQLPVNEPQRLIQVSIKIPSPVNIESLPKHTKVVFDGKCTRKNEQGTPCRVDAGFGMFNLHDLLDQSSSRLPFRLTVPLVLNTCNDYEKGRLLVTTESSFSTIDRFPSVGKRLAPVAQIGHNYGGNGLGLYDHLYLRHRLTNPEDKEPVPAVEEETATYIKKIVAYEMAMPNTDRETANVRVPIYYGDPGMVRRVPLPAASFMMFQTPKSNLKFWTNTVEICLARDGRNVNDVMNMRRMDLTQRARLMVEMCCALVQSLDYIGDFFDMNKRFTQRVEGFLAGSPDVVYDPSHVRGCERFGDALRDRTGDCEDLALAIIMIWCALLDAGEAGLFGSPSHAYLREIFRIARQYVPLVTLDSVMAMAIKAEQDKGRDATGRRQLGAHMAVKFMPTPYFKECLERTDGEMGLDNARRTPFLPMEPDAAELPILVGEGTGMFECWGLIIDPISGERSYVYSHLPSLAFAKKPIVHPPHAGSGFYVGSMVALTPYWFRLKHNLGGVWLGYTGRYADPSIGPTDGSVFHRGVKFVEMDRRSDRMCILPHPVFSESMMEWMRVCTQVRVPPRDLILTPEGASRQPDRFGPLDELVGHAASFGRVRTVDHDPAPAYVGAHQFTPEIISGLKRDIARSPLITGISYTSEHLTDWAHVYRVGIHANTTEQ